MGIRTKMLNVIFSDCFKRMIIKNNRFYKCDVIETKSKRSLNITWNWSLFLPELLGNFMQCFLKVFDLNVDFVLILSFNFLAFSQREIRINSFKRETIKFS